MRATTKIRTVFFAALFFSFVFPSGALGASTPLPCGWTGYDYDRDYYVSFLDESKRPKDFPKRLTGMAGEHMVNPDTRRLWGEYTANAEGIVMTGSELPALTYRSTFRGCENAGSSPGIVVLTGVDAEGNSAGELVLFAVGS
ncbi:hypothetical protein [Streptomyces virginiae]|uniref:hypothetical protein n=1 Tax=Streptomyces virginiae TaxID=1961 RepID=UPI0033233801